MDYMLKKTVVIGLGGTGMHAVLHMKKKLLDTYDEIPPMMKFLVIDTTDRDYLQIEGGEVELELGEFLKIEVKNPSSLMKNEEVKKWLPPNVPKFALTAGAKQVRSLGRLAVFANSSPLESKIDGLISSIRNFKIGRYDNKYQLLSGNIVVNIVCSLAGGTGSGCLLDVLALTRKNLASTDKLIGYFLLPDVFSGKPATDNVEANTFSAIKELNYFFTEGAKMRYTLGGREREIEEGSFFNAVYLINNVNRRGDEYSEIEDLQEFLGLGMFLQSSSTGKGASDISDNLEALLIGQKWFGKPTVYSSFGVGELVYPGDWFADLYAKETALSVVQKVFIGGNGSQVKELVEDFVDKIGIREDTADEVINTILPPGDFRGFPLPPSFGKETIEPTFGRRQSHLNDVRRELGEISGKNVANLKKEKVNALNDYLMQRLRTSRQLVFCRSFLATLIGRLAGFKDMMVKERGDCVNQRERLGGKHDLVKLETQKASKKIFGTKAAIETALKRFKGIVDKELNLILEIQRREGAVELFAHIIGEARRRLEKLNSLSQYFNTLTQELNQDIQHTKLENKGIRPFVHEIKPDLLTDWTPTVEPQDFLIWMENEKQMNVMQFTGMRIGEVKDILVEYGNSLEKVKEIRGKRIDDILRELSKDEKMEYIGLLDGIAAPLWQYDQGIVSGGYKTTNIYLFGVENPDDTAFDPEEIRTATGSPYPPSIIRTGDSKRVMCFKVEAAVPAFVVSKMPQYREKYMIPERDRPFPYHIDRNLEKELPPLFPEEGEEGARKYWSLALASPFDLILKRGEYYYIKSDKKGKRTEGYMLKLAQGRAEAMKAFLADGELVEETRENIEKITPKLGNDKVIKILKGYGSDLETKAKRQTEEIRSQVEMELKDIENYIESLSYL